MMIFLIRKGLKKEELKEKFEKEYYKLDFNLEELRKTYKFKISCAETVPQAFMAFYESSNFEDAIRNAISIGGDSDTIGAICGSIAAEYYGIPNYIYKNGLNYFDEYQKEIYASFKERYMSE
jgi:type I restriction enzyme M protein